MSDFRDSRSSLGKTMTAGPGRQRVGVALCLLFACLSGCARKPPPPNILLISLDTLRADHVGAYGYARETTPFLDALAGDGVLFRNAFVNCLPTPASHTTILSSWYQETHLMFHAPSTAMDIRLIPDSVPLVQEVLGRHGYATVAVTGGGYVGGALGFRRGFDEFDDQVGNAFHAARRLVALAGRPAWKNRPVFAFFHTYEIHMPYRVPEEYRSMFGHFESDLDVSAENLFRLSLEGATLSPEDLAVVEVMYDRGIRLTDDALRVLFDGLKLSGFLDHALVIITSDHGEEFGEHGGLGHGDKLYDELLRVPLIVQGPDGPRGKIVERLVSSVDIVPTILAAAGVEPQWPVAGRDLLALPAASGEEVVISQVGQALYSVRTPEWKLITRAGTEPSEELYDLRADPREQVDVSESFPDAVRKLRGLLEGWRAGLPPSVEEVTEVPLLDEQREKLKALGYIQ